MEPFDFFKDWTFWLPFISLKWNKIQFFIALLYVGIVI